MCGDYTVARRRSRAVRHWFMYSDVVRFLGIDYGRRRIGLALSDATGLLARPWKTIEAQGGLKQVAATIVAEIVTLQREEDGLGGVVLGFPRKLGGDPTDQTAAIESLAAMLRERIEVPLILQDERLSSREAESLLARRMKNWRDRKRVLDAASAAVILQDYLDGRRGERIADDGTEDDRS
jgi:putative Holliday junction resolvase